MIIGMAYIHAIADATVTKSTQLYPSLELSISVSSLCSSIFQFLVGKLSILGLAIVLKRDSLLHFLGSNSRLDGEVWGQVLLVNVRKEGWRGYTGWGVLQDLQNISHSGERPKDCAGETSFEFCLTGEQYLYHGKRVRPSR